LVIILFFLANVELSYLDIRPLVIIYSECRVIGPLSPVQRVSNTSSNYVQK